MAIKRIWSYYDERTKALELESNPKMINYKEEQGNFKTNVIALIKLYKEKGMNKSQVNKATFDFLQKYRVGFCYSEMSDMIDSLVDKYTKPSHREFRKVEDVFISEEELNHIHAYGDKNIERILFCALVISKSKAGQKSDKLYLNIDTQTLFKISKAKRPSTKVDRSVGLEEYRDMIFYNLIQQGWFEFASSRMDNSNKVLLYGNKYSSKDTHKGIVIPINELRNEDLSLFYLEWLGEDKIGNCSECGIKFLDNKKVKNPSKYCKKCAKVINITKTKNKKSLI